MNRFPRGVRVLVGALLVTGGAFAALSRVLNRVNAPIDWLLLASLGGLLVLAEVMMVRYRYGDDVNALNHFDAVLAPLLLAGPVLVVLAIVAAAQAIAAALRRNDGVKSAFNIAQWLAAASAGRLVLDGLHATGDVSRARTLLALPLAMFAVGVVNQIAFTAVVSLAERQPLRRVLHAFGPVIVPGWLAGWGVNTAFGMVFSLAVMASRTAAPLLAVPLLVLHSAYRARAIASAERARARGMHRASRILAASIDARDALPRFLGEVVSIFGASAAEGTLLDASTDDENCYRVSFVSSDGEVRRNYAEHVSPLTTQLLARGDAIVLGTGRDPRLDHFLAAEGWRDCLAAPLVVDGETVGVLCVFDRSGFEGNDHAELVTLESLARETAVALWKARMVSEIVDEQRKLAEIVNHASDGILTLTADGVVASWNPELERITGYAAGDMVGRRSLARLAVRDGSGLGYALEDWALEDWTSGHSVFPSEVRIASQSGEVRRLSCSFSPVPGPNGQPSLLIVVARDTTEAHAMQELQEDYRRLTELEAAQRAVVDQLQEAVRPPMPVVPGVELGVHYRPADEIAPTGGDLYDWHVLPDGDVHLAVVDVMGKGVGATKDAMAVTSALRLLALEGCPLESIMARADALMSAQSADLVATTIVARYTPATGRLRLAGAGHPPALVVRADGTTHLLAAPGIALGWPGAASFEITEWELDRDDTLVLYTDGLVEATKNIIEGLDSLTYAASAATDYPAGKLARVLVERSLAGAQRRDDSLALVLRRRSGLVHGGVPERESFEQRLLPKPERVALARRALVGWLSEAGVSSEMSDDIVLVASELVTNAIRVARGEVALRAHFDRDGVILEVEDDGGGGLRWPAPNARVAPTTAESGRGLLIVEQLTGDVSVFSDGDGTVVRCARRAHAQSTPADRLVQLVADRLSIP